MFTPEAANSYVKNGVLYIKPVLNFLKSVMNKSSIN